MVAKLAFETSCSNVLETSEHITAVPFINNYIFICRNVRGKSAVVTGESTVAMSATFRRSDRSTGEADTNP